MHRQFDRSATGYKKSNISKMSDEDSDKYKDVLKFRNFIDYKNRCEKNDLSVDHPFYNFDIK